MSDQKPRSGYDLTRDQLEAMSPVLKAYRLFSEAMIDHDNKKKEEPVPDLPNSDEHLAPASEWPPQDPADKPEEEEAPEHLPPSIFDFYHVASDLVAAESAALVAAHTAKLRRLVKDFDADMVNAYSVHRGKKGAEEQAAEDEIDVCAMLREIVLDDVYTDAPESQPLVSAHQEVIEKAIRLLGGAEPCQTTGCEGLRGDAVEDTWQQWLCGPCGGWTSK